MRRAGYQGIGLSAVALGYSSRVLGQFPCLTCKLRIWGPQLQVSNGFRGQMGVDGVGPAAVAGSWASLACILNPDPELGYSWWWWGLYI